MMKLSRTFVPTTAALCAVGLLVSAASLSGCRDGDRFGTDLSGNALQAELSTVVHGKGLKGKPIMAASMPGIDEALPQLGMRLFFSASLGGEFDTACVTCHHPKLGGGDAIALPIGTEAVDPDVLGPGRRHIDGAPPVPRNSPTVFNTGLWQKGLFVDSRVRRLGPGQISTPDSGFGAADSNAGSSLAAAQALFPVTSDAEMRGHTFMAGQSNDALRIALAARLQTDWADEFGSVFGTSGPITFTQVAEAIGAYEQSMVFVNTAWSRFVGGDQNAVSEAAKRGAISFFKPAGQGGMGCASCHSGDRFTDEKHHVLGFPQIGSGKGDGANGTDDYGRARETGNNGDRYHFRTPSLLNVARTAPYGHSGAYATLDDVLEHYDNPRRQAERYVDRERWCDQPQFAGVAGCESLYPDARANTRRALDKLRDEQRHGDHTLRNLRINGQQKSDLIAFLRTLTDPCLDDPACIGQWIPADDGGPDGNQLSPVLP
ncbi:MAG: cytochrome c peroxidase [Myxococcota bacterium]|jgi:cytochrome c peroxidase